jgi:hypothetical protein
MLPRKSSKEPLEERQYHIADLSRRAPMYEVIDSAELATRWSLPESWIREQTRCRAVDPIPCVRVGRYVRFEWGSPQLLDWWGRRRTQ